MRVLDIVDYIIALPRIWGKKKCGAFAQTINDTILPVLLLGAYARSSISVGLRTLQKLVRSDGSLIAKMYLARPWP